MCFKPEDTMMFLIWNQSTSTCQLIGSICNVYRTKITSTKLFIMLKREGIWLSRYYVLSCLTSFVWLISTWTMLDTCTCVRTYVLSGFTADCLYWVPGSVVKNHWNDAGKKKKHDERNVQMTSWLTSYLSLWSYQQRQVGTTRDTGWVRLIRIRLIRSFFEIFARFLSFHVQNAWLIQTRLIQSSTNLK